MQNITNMKPIVETIQLRPGTNVMVTYSAVPPEAPPDNGHSWPEDLDAVGLQVELSLPCGGTSHLKEELQSAHSVMGSTLTWNWGAYETNRRYRRLSTRCSDDQPTLGHLYRGARAYVAEQLAVLGEVLDARAARLAQREVTIQLQAADSPFDGV